jgi:hypothetical protein
MYKTAPIFEVVFDPLIKSLRKELVGCFCRVIRHPTRAAAIASRGSRVEVQR